MKLRFILVIVMLCSLVGCTKPKTQNNNTNNAKNNYQEEKAPRLQCDPDCTFEQRLEQQYHLNPNDYINKNDSVWVKEQKQKFILDSLPKDYNFDTNPDKGEETFGANDVVRNGLSFEFSQNQISDNYLYFKSHTRESYNQAGDFMWWYENLLLDIKNQKILAIHDIVKDEASQNRIIEIIAKSSVGEHLLKSCYSECENPENKQKELIKRTTDIFEHNWELANSSVQWCFQTGGNSGQSVLAGSCIALTNEQAKKLIRPEFLK